MRRKIANIHNFLGQRVWFSFGRGDITVGQNAFAKARSSSCLGQTYKHSLYKEDSKEAESFLAGFEKYRLEEI